MKRFGIFLLAFAITLTFGAGARAQGDDASVIDASSAGGNVSINAVPAPEPVIQVLSLKDPVAKIRSVKKARLDKKTANSVMLLSRTERRQVALLALKDKRGEPLVRYDSNGDYQGGVDDLDLHRSYARPKVVEDRQLADPDEMAVAPELGIRLMMARLKALETHALAQVPDDGEPLPDTVKLRLLLARAKALQAFEERHAG